MRDFVIFTDSTCDLGKDIRDKYNIEYVQMNVVVNDKEMVADLDWNEFSPKEFYDWMRKGTRIFTNQVPYSEYYNKFKKTLEEEKDILYLGCSSRLSGSISLSYNVRDELIGLFPDSKIICVDTLRSTLGEGLIAIKASELRKEGKTIEEVSEYIENYKLNFHTIATAESLSYLKRAGRVKAAAAFFGNIIGVKPMIIADAKGNNYAVKKVKGRRASLLEVINMMKENIIEPEKQIICVEHADCDIDNEFIKQHIMDTFNPKDVYVSYIGPIIGASIGPGSIIVSYYGEKETIVGE